MSETGKCFICGRSTRSGMDICPDCFSRLPQCCQGKTKYEKLTKEEKKTIITSPLWQMRIYKSEAYQAFGERLGLYPERGVFFFSGNNLSMENIDNVQFEQKIIKITEGDNAQQMRIKLKVYVKIKTHTPKLSLTDYLGTIEFPLEEGKQFPNIYWKTEQMLNNWEKPVKIPNMTYHEASTLYMFQGGYTKEDLSKRRKNLLKVFHPDQKGEEECAKRINMAYNILRPYAK